MDTNLTINQIANALHLSRNTVSKVINNKPGVSAKTKKLVMDYLESPQPTPGSAENACANRGTILFSYRLENVEYINGLLAGIEQTVKENGYLLGLNIVQTRRGAPIALPSSLTDGSVSGIISFNIYDHQYWNAVIETGVPAAFIDTPHDYYPFSGKTEIIMPENETCVRQLVRTLYQQGCRRFGYFGYPYYCLSLKERWRAFQESLQELGLDPDDRLCLVDDFSEVSDLDAIGNTTRWLQHLPALPDTIICASDRQAILLMQALKALSIRVPEDLKVAGFDNLPETLRQSPTLTTIESGSKFQGELAVRKIIERLARPDKPYEIIHCQSRLILRESTGHSLEKS